MTHTTWLLVLLGMLSGRAGPSRPATVRPPVSDSSTTLYEISNLKVIHRFRESSDIVAVRLYLLGGARQLSQGNAGIEVLLLRAAELEHSHTIERTGSHVVLDATLDWTVIGFTGLRQDLDSSWSGFARELGRPTFSEVSLDRARGELLTLARRRYTQPDLRIRAGAQRAAFPGHPYALDPEGTVPSLTSLSRTDLESYWRTEFVTSRMLLVVVGGVRRDKLDSLITASLGALPPGEYKWVLPPPAPTRPSSWMREHQHLPTNYILGYFAGPHPTDREHFSFRVAVAVLSSRLERQIREERALSYNAHAPWLDRALPIGGIYTSTSRPDEAIVVIRRVLGEMKAFVPWGYQPRWWRRFLNGYALEALMTQLTSSEQAEALARAYLYFGDLKMTDELARRLGRVSYWSISDMARRYMRDIQFAYMGDTTLMRGKW